MSPRITAFKGEEDPKQGIECFLQTKASRFRKHFVKVQDRDVQFFKSLSDSRPMIVHTLTGTAV